MQTSTTKQNRQYSLTIFLLCIGYFMDFYDLTIFSASYSSIIKELFHVYDLEQIQLLYLQITNFFTAGIIVGSITFGILGDKFGRVTVIRYSILLYSIAIILSVFTHSITMFMFLRFLAGAGLAAEFATSSVLISELLPQKIATKYTSVLYFCGILGGITATFLSAISWQVMFLFGGIAGLMLYLLRKNLFESQLFLQIQSTPQRGNFFHLINHPYKLLKLFKLFVLITPFYFLISIMFIYPNFMPIKAELGHLIRLLLIGFFIGNLLSTIASYYIVSQLNNYRIYLLISSLVFAVAMSVFKMVNQELFFTYAVILGLLGGGHPTVWIQVVARSYGTNQRSTAANTLYALGRSSCIGFNLLISTWIMVPQHFADYAIITTLIITFLVVLVLANTKDNYESNIDYLEGKNN